MKPYSAQPTTTTTSTSAGNRCTVPTPSNLPCPTQVLFDFSADFGSISSSVSGFEATLTSYLASFLNIDASRIQNLVASSGSIGVSFYLQATVDAAAVSSTAALAQLQTAVQGSNFNFTYNSQTFNAVPVCRSVILASYY